MESRLPLWVVFLGLVAATGCASRQSFDGTVLVDKSDHQRMKGQSTVMPIVDAGVTRAAPSEYSPTASVKNTMAELLSILGNEELQQPERSEDRRQKIEQVIRHRVNYAQMAKRSLGAPWASLTDAERQEFVSLFVQLLRDRFASKIDEYYDEEVFYLFEQRAGSFAEVRTRLIGPKVDTWLDFRLENRSSDWLVYDVVIDGASIVSNYGMQFSRILRDDSYEGLVEKIKQKALVVKVFEKNTSSIALFPPLPYFRPMSAY